MNSNAVGLELSTLFLFFLLGILFVLFKPSRFKDSAGFKGYIGERQVGRKIKSLLRRNNEYRSFHNITLETPDGTTQIDHALVSPYGIFVIETKNRDGWIFGGADQKQWTQSLYGYNYKFQNPLHQNFKHVKAIQNLLGANIKTVVSVVVFVGESELMTEMPNNVLELPDFLPYIRSYTETILDGDSVERYTQQLSNSVHYAPDKQPEHVSNVERNRQNPICPRCGKPMILRTARNGPSSGSNFWGCSGYPYCKALKNIPQHTHTVSRDYVSPLMRRILCRNLRKMLFR